MAFIDVGKKKKKKFSGFYSNIDDDLIVFYRNCGRLYLQLTNILYDFDELSISVLRKESFVKNREIFWTREVIISFRNRDIYNRIYNNFCQEFEDDPTPFVEEEHFDFYLFLKSVSMDSYRKRSFFS